MGHRDVSTMQMITTTVPYCAKLTKREIAVRLARGLGEVHVLHVVACSSRRLQLEIPDIHGSRIFGSHAKSMSLKA